NSQVNKIIVSDSGSHEVVVNVGQITSDAAGLGELYNTNGTTHANVTVNDVAATISGAFDALNANTQVNKILVSDSATNEVTLLAAQIAADATALAELYVANGSALANVKVADTAAGISAAFDTLNGSAQVNKIVVTNSAGHEVTISVAQVGADTTAISELFNADGTTPAHVAVSDTAANISAALAALNGNTHVDHIIISDSASLTLTVSQLVNDTTALGEIVGPYTVIVSDTGAHISANLDALEANPSVTQVIVTDNHDVTVSIAQLTSDASVLSVMMDANGLSPASLRISDTAANIQANLGNLQADTFNHNIHVITISDSGAITLSASQLTIDSTVLLDLRNANATQVQLTLSDTGGHIQAVLDQIEAYNTTSGTSKISSIIVSNSGQMTVTAQQVHDDASILAEVTNRNGSPVTFKVVDTAANITTYLNALQANTQLSTIVVSDNGAIGISVAQLTADAGAIGLLHNQNATAYSLTVTDTAAHVQNALMTLNNNSHVDKIVVSDSATSEVHFSVSQIVHDTNVLGELFNSDGTTHASIELVDSAGHIQAMTASQIQALAGDGVNIIDSTNNKLMLAVAQYEALGTVQLTQSDAVSITDTGAHVSAMSDSELAGLSAAGVDRIVTTDHQVTFALDQWNALSVGVDSATTITVNGTSGSDSITATSINNFVLNGGGGADTMTVSTGHDIFVYGAASDSTGPTYDTIIGLDTTRDMFHLNSAVTGIDTAVNSGMLDSGASFNAELAADIGAAQLGANHAVLFTATSGSLSGHTFLIVDTNGMAGYQAGADLVIDVTGGHHLTGLATSDFITG
ncbi:MAG TPA: bluetail domain-containing putative surface protein, partial [Rhizomicrobium sp.]|nr:bluetail domain-containing putative surface protein [Rhizomicrobium sp.]